LDWMWEMTAVTCVGVLVLGLVCGSDAGGGRPALVRDESRRRARGRLGLGLAVGVVAWLLVCTEAISLLTALEVRKSQAAVRAGDAHLALSRARAAAEIEPWAATPYLQLALVEQAVGDLGAAEHSIRSALQRDTRDWRLWVVAARIEAARGGRIEAEASLRRARTLNPRSPSLTATP
jgi:tetratricopeptide (TPR) repeat protein